MTLRTLLRAPLLAGLAATSIHAQQAWLDSSAIGNLYDDKGTYRFDESFAGTIAGGAAVADPDPLPAVGPATVPFDAIAFFGNAYVPFEIEDPLPDGVDSEEYQGLLSVEPAGTPNLAGIRIPLTDTGGSVLLLGRAVLGGGFGKVVPTLLIGSEIPVPDVDLAGDSFADGVDPASYWATKPYEDTLDDPFGSDVTFLDDLPSDFEPRYYYSPHSRRVYASSNGTVEVYFRTRQRQGDGNFHVKRFTYQVSSASEPARARKLFWNQKGFSGPLVEVPSGTVSSVHFVYNNQVPQRVAEEYLEPGEIRHDPIVIPDITGGDDDIDLGSGGEELRTVWFDRLGGFINAYNAEGRLLIEFLGAQQGEIDDLRNTGTVPLFQSLGVVVLELEQGLEPTGVAEMFIGDRVLPVQEPFPAALSKYTPAQPLNAVQSGPGAFLEPVYAPAQEIKYYAAVRTTGVGERVTLYWMAEAATYDPEANSGHVEFTGIEWPKYHDQYAILWPDESSAEEQELYARYLAPVGDQDDLRAGFPSDRTPEIIFQDPLNPVEVDLDPEGRVELQLPDSGQVRFLLRLTSTVGDPWFLRLLARTPESLRTDIENGGVYDLWLPDDETVEYGSDTPPEIEVAVGDVIRAPGGFNAVGSIRHATTTVPYAVELYTDPLEVDVGGTLSESLIIPVNTLENRDFMEVWWSLPVSPPDYVADDFAPICFPYAVGRYRVSWPDDAPIITIGRAADAGEPRIAGVNGKVTLPASWGSATIYRDGDPGSRGYNPNEEHAFIRSTDLFVIRDDLNVYSQTSEPYVLVSYVPLDGSEPGIAVYEVRRGLLDYLAVAGSAVGGINSLLALPLPLEPEIDSNGLETGRFVTLNREITPPDFPAGVTSYAELDLTDLNYATFTVTDKVGTTWIYRGPHADDDSPQLLMERYYPFLDEFDIPGSDTTGFVESGVNLPFVREYARDENDEIITLADGTPVFSNGYSTFDVALESGETLALPLLDGNGDVAFNDPDPLDTNLLDDRPAPVVIRPVWPDYFEVNNDGLTPDDPGYLDPLDFGINPQSLTYGTLRQGETLYSARNGLPAIGSSTSVEILYDQDRAQTYDEATRSASIRLIDPTVAKRTLLAEDGLDELPSVPTTVSNGRHYFGNLPSHLESRFFYDPNQGALGALVLEGEFVDEIAGEDYLQLNILSATDIQTLKEIVPASDPNRDAWDDAIDSLSVTVTTYQRDIFQDPQPLSVDSFASLLLDFDIRAVATGELANGLYPHIFGETFGPGDAVVLRNDDQAADTYSAVGTARSGERWVTLVSGNGVFSDEGDPTQYFIFKSSPELYIGEGKIVASENPLNEKLSIRLSNDFGGAADQFEIEWAKSDPVGNGAPPAEIPAGEAPLIPWEPDIQNSGVGSFLVNVGGSGVDVLKDKYYSARYRRLDGNGDPAGEWSAWSVPLLVEGWIKRVLAGINPFNQRLTDFANNPVNSDVSILTQAGTRWEGDVPLNLENIDDFGLIAIYETVLKRGINLSIGASPPVNDRTANQALLLAANYLGDLYNALGDEAYTDALNPTVALDSEVIDTTLQVPNPSALISEFSETATARFSFEGQLPNLLAEELALLRGRDDFLATRTDVSPIYNRLYWNFTRGIDLGEVIYALNYNIREGATSPYADGTLDAADASRLFPQGHGDAYGHYLTGLKNYYRLLADPNYDWIPEAETINLLGQTVQVDYRDERKFAAMAVSLAETAGLVANLTHRQNYSDRSDRGWGNLRDGATSPRTGETRHWGLDDWVSRGSQATYYNWLVANTIVPAPEALGLDPDSLAPDVTRVTRADVPEIDLLPTYLEQLQRESDLADQHLSPLGLQPDSMAFDLSAAEYREGRSHFEQIYDRAVRAVENAANLFSRAADATRLLRQQQNQVDSLDKVIADNEVAYEFQLTDLLGTPYPEDIGPGRLYPQGYDGPDFFSYMKIERIYHLDDDIRDPTTMVGIGERVTDYRAYSEQAKLLQSLFATDNYEAFFAEVLSRTGVDNEDTNTLVPAGSTALSYVGLDGSLIGRLSQVPSLRLDEVNNILANLGLPALTEDSVADPEMEIVYQYDPRDEVIYVGPGAGRRSREGQIQVQLRNAVEARIQVEAEIDAFSDAVDTFEGLVRLHREAYLAQYRTALLGDALFAEETAVINNLRNMEISTARLETAGNLLDGIAEVAKEAFPTVVGFSSDVTSGARAAIMGAIRIAGKAATNAAVIKNRISTANLETDFRNFEIAVETAIRNTENAQALREMFYEIETEYAALVASAASIDVMVYRLAQERAKLNRLLHDVQHTIDERERFRQRVAGVIHGYRIRDNAFRGFRNEALEQYRNLFDLASQYTYLAAKAYDFETGLLGTDDGEGFFNQVVGSRALGVIADGTPRFIGNQTGDPGLSGVLAQLDSDWQVAKPRLGINNPDALGTTFSLRQEWLRILPTLEADSAWVQFLEASLVRDLRSDADATEHALGLDDGSGLPVPGLVIEFPTAIRSGENFFGMPLAAGDSNFYSGSFATKVHSVGIVFTDYAGVDSTPIGGSPGDPLADNGLTATPYVYLIPVGSDRLRVPFGTGFQIRNFNVHDQILPLPFNIGGSDGNEPGVTYTLETLPEAIYTPRKHQAFRAVNDPAFFYSAFYDEFTNSRLVGRSAWNSRWKLIIPGRNLLADDEEGLSRFIRSVKDIQVHLRTYSHSGN